jgi:hypothetical protein
MRRSAAIDLIRGYCIISMVTAHIAAGSLLAKATHVFPEFDGASGFVLLSGLVLGMVQRRRVESSGLWAVQVKTLRRTGVIYVGQLFIVGLGLLMGLSATHAHRNVTPLDLHTTEALIFHAVTMTLAPPSGSVLRLYVVLLLLALGAYALLSRDRWKTLLGLSLALYALAQVFPAQTSFRAFDAQTLGASWAGWQLLFFGAMLFGWHWKSMDVPGWLAKCYWATLAASAAVIAAAPALSGSMPALFDKVTFAPGRTIVAFAVVCFLYQLLTAALRVAPSWLYRPVEMIGRRSLDAYIVQASVAVILPSFISYSATAAQFIAVAVLAACWGWAELRDRRGTPNTPDRAPKHRTGATQPARQRALRG